MKIYAVAADDSVPDSALKPLFKVLTIQPTERIRGGAFADVEALPTNYVIDRASLLRYAKAGAFDLDDLKIVLVPLMREPAPAV